MELQDLKIWHWCLLGLVAGGLLAATRIFYGQDVDRDNQESMQGLFDRVVVGTEKSPRYVDDFDNGYVYLSDLRVYPPTPDTSPEASRSNGKPENVQWVIGKIYRTKLWRGKKGNSDHLFRYKAQMPFKPQSINWVTGSLDAKKPVVGYVQSKDTTYPSITTYFDEVNKKYGSGTVRYRYAWWESQMFVMVAYPLAGLFLVGGIWPMVLAMMTGAGLVKKKEKPQELDMSRYTGKSKLAEKKSTAISDADQEKLQTVTDQLEAELKASAKAGGTKTIEQTNDPAIRKLDGAGTGASVTIDPHLAAVKSFGTSGGAFYPTEIHTDKKPG